MQKTVYPILKYWKLFWLVVWNPMEFYNFPETVGNGKIIPTDEVIFFRVGSTTNQSSLFLSFKLGLPQRMHREISWNLSVSGPGLVHPRHAPAYGRGDQPHSGAGWGTDFAGSAAQYAVDVRGGVDLWWSKGFDGGFMVDFMVDLFGYDDLHWYLLYS